MPKKYLVDTDVLIDFLRGYGPAASFLEKHASSIHISTISVAELYAGVRENEEKQILADLISSFQCIPLTANIAGIGGIYRRDFGRTHGTGLADALIAASAALSDATLITLNNKHYPMLKDIKVPYHK